jgi:hypothetical protein
MEATIPTQGRFDARWQDDMAAWVDRSLAHAGIRRTAPATLVRSWARSGLLSVETDHGRFWAKAVPEVFAHEIALAVLLTDVDPGSVAPPLAADVAAGRMITGHVEGPLLVDVRGEPAGWIATLARLAELQRVLAADTTALEMAGVARSGVGELADAVARLLGDDRLLRVGRSDGLTAAEAGRLRKMGKDLAAACRELDAIGVPESLDHGDFHARQVIVGAMGPVILDWSDGSITDPFLSAAAFLEDPAVRGDGVPARSELAEAYLGPWVASGAISAEAGRRALDLATGILPVHAASLYADRVLPGLGWPDDADVTGVVPAMLRRLL